MNVLETSAHRLRFRRWEGFPLTSQQAQKESLCRRRFPQKESASQHLRDQAVRRRSGQGGRLRNRHANGRSEQRTSDGTGHGARNCGIHGTGTSAGTPRRPSPGSVRARLHHVGIASVVRALPSLVWRFWCACPFRAPAELGCATSASFCALRHHLRDDRGMHSQGPAFPTARVARGCSESDRLII